MISVIIPIYNGEKYIDSMYGCLKGQTYTDLQILFVNDGSTDRSAELCDQLAAEDGRITVIHQANGGVSSARNAALEAATGAYIAYLDVDDLVQADYFERLLCDAEKSNADLVCCGYEERSPFADGSFTVCGVYSYEAEIVQTVEQYCRDLFGSKRYMWQVWGKLFRADIAKTVRFQPIRYGEDSLYMYDIFQQCIPRTYLSSYAGYFYIRWEQSATRSAQKKGRNIQRAFSSVILRHLYIQLDEPRKEDAIRAQRYLNQFAGYLIAVIESGNRGLYYSDDFEKNVFFDNYKKHIKYRRGMSFKRYLILKTYCINKQLCWQVVELFSKNKEKIETVP